MSFGGFGGFGANNQQQQQQQQPQQNTGFAGFGANTNTNTNTAGGFGTTANTGFGNTAGNTGGGLFGNNNATSTAGGFGASTASSSPFGAKPTFGTPNTSTTGGGLFGASTNTTTPNTGFGGFGNTANTNATGGGFGGGAATGGGMFGQQNKPAFGGGTTGGSLFGGGTNTTGGGAFGASTTGGFGATPSTGFGTQQQQQQQQPAQNQGTAVTPFSAHTEKDSATNSNSNYQSISFQQPYLNYSFEELRLADYNAGRRYGNSNGQAGAFGTSTGFGGFGQTSGASTGGFGGTANTGGGLFGQQNQTSQPAQTQSPFGQNQQSTTSGFGGGGLFGNQQKPAGGGLFGSTPAASGQTSGGLFGTSGGTGGFGTGAFGASTTNNASTGGGLFGQNQTQNQTQNKPFGGFGASTGGFGQQQQQQPQASTGGGLFGASTTTSNAFGGGQQQQSGGGLFGGGFGQNQNNQNQQQNQTQPQTGGGLFGGFGQANNSNNQQKPSMFGASTGNTGANLFGGNQQQQQPQQQQTGGLFGGGNNNNQQSSGLFGAKPATTGASLFGGAQSNTGTTSGGLFGNTQPQQNQTTSLFGGQNQQDQQKPSLFGGSTNNNAGGSSLFGGQNNNQNAFGGSQQQQPQSGSLFGTPQNNMQQSQQTPLTASLMQNPYGNDQLFANLGSPSPPVGPLATPLSGAQKPAKRPSMLPSFKINPSQSMRLITPQKRANGFGFQYSSYGTPGSAQSFSSSRGSSLLGTGGMNRSLSKSFSTSNLKNATGAEDSVLAPGAFTPNPRPYSNGNSIRKLKIDRTLRTDLFGPDAAAEPPSRPTKRVSFDATTTNGSKELQSNGNAAPSADNALVRTETDGPEPTPEELGLLRAERRPATNGAKQPTKRPEMEEVRGNELAIVPEDEQVPATEPRAGARKGLRKPQTDQEPGDYYMTPSIDELRDLPRTQLKQISGFVVGRVGVGRIAFDDVDLTAVPLDQILGEIVKLNIRSATVYETGVNTPPMGKGLNVPSTLVLENSWPRSNGGRLPVHERQGSRYEKHIQRLKRVEGTDFISYNAESGEWVFRVEHFTTYGLDDDDDEDETMQEESSGLSAPPDTPTPKAPTPFARATETSLVSQDDSSMISPENSDAEDTFDFKKRSGRSVPGGFGNQSIFDDYDDVQDDEDLDRVKAIEQSNALVADDPFDEPSMAPMSPPETDNEAERAEQADHGMAGSFPANTNDFGASMLASFMPKSILKAPQPSATPPKKKLELGGDWAEQLQRTVSPRKQDRQALRERQNVPIAEPTMTASILKPNTTGRAFNSTMDIMNSLWGKQTSAPATAPQLGKGFEWPYAKHSATDTDTANMSDSDRAFHASIKPSWATDGLLVYGIPGSTPSLQAATIADLKKSVVSAGKDIRFAKFVAADDTDTPSLQLQVSKMMTTADKNGVPGAQTAASLTFAALAETSSQNTPQGNHERQVWTLASILFDPLDISCAEFVQGVPADQVSGLEDRIRRDTLSLFWSEMVRHDAASHVKNAATAEEKTLAYLSCNNIEDACATLIDGRDFRLATVLSQLPGDDKANSVMAKQIQSWRSQNVLSEMPDAVRALYELSAGNACISEGKTGPAEDRASTFGLSERFALDWRRSFGLRLWFAADDVAAAVEQYVDDVDSGREAVRPVPYFTEQKLPFSWDDPKLQDRQDALLAILRLYVKSSQQSLAVTDLFTPSSVSGNPLNARLCWQLITTLRARNALTRHDIADAALDELTLVFAAQLENAKLTTLTTRALLVLSTPTARSHYIQDQLNRNAADLDPAVVNTLTQDLCVPPSWLWRAKALLAASTHDAVSQVSHLLRADDRSEAHVVLCRQVGPKAVIERDYDALRELLAGFTGEGAAIKASMVDGWRTGGQVYADFLHLVDLTSKGDESGEKSAVIKRLSATLPGVMEGRRGRVGLEERVAVAEMAGWVKTEAEKMHDEKVLDEKRLARLPVPDDTFVKQSAKMAGLYYRAVDVQ